jgi:ATP-dependent Lon protease
MQSDILSNDYEYCIHEIQKIIKNTENNDIELEIKKNIKNDDESNIKKIIKSNMSLHNKSIAYKNAEILEHYKSQKSDEYIKYKIWLNKLLSIPFGIYNDSNINNDSSINDIQEYLSNIRYNLNKNISFLEKPKDQIINIFSQLIKNPLSKINSIGLYGPKGVGKSRFCQSLADALNRPLKKISLGGSNDSSILNGHDFTYIGSKPGKIIDILIESKVSNPIILFDELDKVSNTDKGKELIGTLIHLTDVTSNNTYNCDNYFSGIEFDLSKILFIFTYNNSDDIDPILADRIYKIKIDNYTFPEKLKITKKHLIKNILTEFNYTDDDIIFTDESIKYLINSSKNHDGMRLINTKLYTILSRINTLLLTSKKNNIINLKYNELYSIYDKLPIIIEQKYIDLLLIDSYNDDKIDNIYNGMYI